MSDYLSGRAVVVDLYSKVTPVELSSMPQTSSAGASAEEGGASLISLRDLHIKVRSDT